MTMNNALLKAQRSFSGRYIACRSFVTENLKKAMGGITISDGAKDSKIRVFWDVQECQVPVDRDAGNVMRNIRDALRGIHCFGPVEFWGYGDMTVVPFLTQSRLHIAGVRLRHVPHGLELQDQVMIADVIAWTNHHPPPVVHMLILQKLYYPHDTHRLKRALDLLRVRGYDTLLVVQPNEEELQFCLHRPDRSDSEIAAGHPDVAWPWKTLLAGPKE